jgi:hypothetical protein
MRHEITADEITWTAPENTGTRTGTLGNIPQGFWDRQEIQRQPITRIAAPEPRATAEIQEDVRTVGDRLQSEIELYEQTKQSNPHQQRLIEIGERLNALIPEVKAVQKEAAELRSRPTPTVRFLESVSIATAKTHALAAEATERALRDAAKERHDITNIDALSKQTKKEILASDAITSIKDLRLPFFSKRWTSNLSLEASKPAIDRVFDGLSRLWEFLNK